MAIAKAIQGLEIIIENKQRLRAKLLDLIKSQNQNNKASKELAPTLVESLQLDLEVLTGIKSYLLPEQKRTKITCRHAKKYHDVTSEGQKYCMNCNADL